MPQPAEASFLDEKLLQFLETLRIVTKKKRRGTNRGEYQSWHSGEGLEFLDYRKYQFGDDLRYVDWSVYGRLDKLFIKLFHAEENQTVHILLDMSRSMQAGTPSKAISAKKLAAAISYACLSNLDKVSMASFADTLLDVRSPVRGKKTYSKLLRFLHMLAPAAATDINACLTEYAALCKTPGIAIILSDLLDPKGYQDGLKALTYRKFDVHLLHILSPDELLWSATGNLALQDMETGEKKVIFVDQTLLDRYQKKLSRFLTGISSFCSDYQITYALYNTQVPFDDFLLTAVATSPLFR